MLELKVYCDCGQKFKFDVEPVNGQMPFTVTCPICHRDGTSKANELIQQMLVFKPIGADPAPVPTGAPPPPLAPPPISPAPAPAARIRIHSPPPAATAQEAVPPAARGRILMAAPAAAAAPGKPASFGMGILGGFLGALVGSIIYFLIFKTTGVRFFLSLLVGGLAGMGAQWMGHGEGSKELGGITVVFVVVGVLAAQYFVLLGIWNGILYEGFNEQLTEARTVVKAVPTGSDEEIRMYLAKQAAEDGDVLKPAAVTTDQIQQFREKELPEYQDLASGKLTKQQFVINHTRDPEKAKKAQSEESDTFNGFFMLATLNVRSIISLVVASGLALRLSTNA